MGEEKQRVFDPSQEQHLPKCEKSDIIKVGRSCIQRRCQLLQQLRFLRYRAVSLCFAIASAFIEDAV